MKADETRRGGRPSPTRSIEESRFCLVPDGQEALTLRAASARLAENTLDCQYYIWEDDEVGKLLLYRALEAARRGVKVRLLLDDANQIGRDVKWAELNAHPNVEVRLFNPFRGRYKHFVQWLYHAPRLNHRMHNKAWIVDGELAIVGGRNISDHYFDVHPQTNFRDLDVYARGPIVAETATAFDAYWHSDVSVQLRSLGRRSRAHADRLWKKLDHWYRQPDRLPIDREYSLASSRRLLSGADRRQIHAPAALLFDPPEKAKGTKQRLIGDQLAKLLGERRLTEILIETGYLIPGDRFVAALKALHLKGCRVAVLTNSLATNDVIAAHAAYARYRPALLDAGVEMHELRPNPQTRGHRARLLRGRRRSKAALHSKAMVLDRRELFVGSFNLDPRSVNLNTEMGYYVDSKRLAGEVATFIEEGMAPQSSYRVEAGEDGLIWGAGDEHGPARYQREPQTSTSRWLASQICALLPIENLL